MSENKLMPLVSIIIPCFNHADFVKETIESVKAQTYENWECIIVDNGSKDSSAEVIQQCIQDDIRFQFVVQENKGVSAARNRAIKMSNGKYILPLDSDDKIGRRYLEKAIHAFESMPDLLIVYCDAELVGEASGKWILPEFSIQNMLVENCIFCSAVYKRADYNRTNGYNEAMQTGFEDWDFWLSLLNAGSDVYKIPEVNFYYRIRSSSRNNSLSMEQQLSLRKMIYKNHQSLYGSGDQIPEIIFKYYNIIQEQRRMEKSRVYRYLKSFVGFIRKYKS